VQQRTLLFVGIARLRSWNPERNAKVWCSWSVKSLPTLSKHCFI